MAARRDFISWKRFIYYLFDFVDLLPTYLSCVSYRGAFAPKITNINVVNSSKKKKENKIKTLISDMNKI